MRRSSLRGIVLRALSSVGVVRVRVRNVSALPWPAGRMVRLGNHWRREGVMLIVDDGRADLPGPLAPGEAVEVELTVRAPTTPGSVEVELDLVQEHVTWWADWGNPTARATVLVTETAGDRGHRTDGVSPGTNGLDPDTNPLIGSPGIAMHGMRAQLVRSVVAACGGRVLEAKPDISAGDEWDSYLYLIQTT